MKNKILLLMLFATSVMAGPNPVTQNDFTTNGAGALPRSASLAVQNTTVTFANVTNKGVESIFANQPLSGRAVLSGPDALGVFHFDSYVLGQSAITLTNDGPSANNIVINGTIFPGSGIIAVNGLNSQGIATFSSTIDGTVAAFTTDIQVSSTLAALTQNSVITSNELATWYGLYGASGSITNLPSYVVTNGGSATLNNVTATNLLTYHGLTNVTLTPLGIDSTGTNIWAMPASGGSSIPSSISCQTNYCQIMNLSDPNDTFSTGVNSGIVTNYNSTLSQGSVLVGNTINGSISNTVAMTVSISASHIDFNAVGASPVFLIITNGVSTHIKYGGAYMTAELGSENLTSTLLVLPSTTVIQCQCTQGGIVLTNSVLTVKQVQ